MVRFLLLLLTGAGLAFSLSAQSGYYWVQFADKAGSPYTLEQADQFLSAEALERRSRHGQEIEEADLPLSVPYLRSVQQTGARIWLQSRWLNGVTVVAEPGTIAQIAAMTFVDTTYFTGPADMNGNGPAARPVPDWHNAPSLEYDTSFSIYYGRGYPALAILRGDTLHQMGYRGRGVRVAVLDGGFPSVNQGEFLGWPSDDIAPAAVDLVEQDGFGYDASSHGSTVLSTMAARHPFLLIGTAPEASYLCIKTENTIGEHRQEEINWAVGLELADSLGADVVNSSLGYTTFDLEEMNYTIANLDGRTSPASRAADLAYARGMIVVNSAGNSGSSSWRRIGIPADAAGVLAVGAIDNRGQRASFSSFGPSADNRIKPDVVAPGVGIPAISSSGQGIIPANGTSLAAPLVTGLVACLWQAFPDRTNREIMEAIRQGANRSAEPDEEFGYGLADFARAYRILQEARNE